MSTAVAGACPPQMSGLCAFDPNVLIETKPLKGINLEASHSYCSLSQRSIVRLYGFRGAFRNKVNTMNTDETIGELIIIALQLLRKVCS